MIKNWNSKEFKIGVLGGGQLGRMLIQEAINLNLHIHIMDPDKNAPCSSIAQTFTCASLTDYDAVIVFFFIYYDGFIIERCNFFRLFWMGLYVHF